MNGICLLPRYYLGVVVAVALLLLVNSDGELRKATPTNQLTTTFNILLNRPEATHLEAAGLTISSAQNLGMTQIDVQHQAVVIEGNESIKRIVGIHPEYDENLDAELVFHYEEQELNGLSEENLILYSSQDEGKTWIAHYNSAVDPATNTIYLDNIDHFSLWTAAPPPPVLNNEDSTCPNALQTSEGASVDGANTGIQVNPVASCLGCTVSNTGNLVDADTTNFATMDFSVAAVITGSVIGQMAVNTGTLPMGSIVGFVFEDAAGILDLGLLGGDISLQTYNGAMLVDNLTLDDPLVNINLLSSTLNQISLTTSGTITQVRLVVNIGALGLARTFNVYYAFVNTPCECLSPDALQTNDGSSVNNAATGVTGALCVLCGVTNAANLVDNDTTNFATLIAAVSIGTEVTVAVNTADIDAGSRVGFVFEDANDILDAGLLGALSIQTYNNGSLVDDVALDDALVNLSLLSATLNQASIVTTNTIDEIRFVVDAGLLGVLTTFNVYFAFVEAPCGCECEDALQTPGTTVNNTNTGIHFNGVLNLCVGCGVTNATNVVNADTTDFGTIALALALDLLGGGYEGVIALNTGPLPGGSKVGFVFEDANGLLGADLLAALSIRTLNNETIVDDVDLSSNLVALQLLGTTQIQKAFITTSGGIDQIQFVVNVDNLLGIVGTGLLQEFNVYYAVQEMGCDNDHDGVKDDVDLDSDNDGIPDAVEEATALNGGDTDGDGIPDIFDLDSDNDGVPDIIEAGGTDIDGDGIADDLTDSDGDGLVDIYDNAPNDPDPGASTSRLPIPDSDGDGHPDFQDLDSDNDTINDITESGIPDTNNDGMVDELNPDGTLSNDSDGDGFTDALDPNNNNTVGTGDGTGTPAITTDPDADNDGQPDDDDGDGTAYNGGDTDSDNVLDLRDLDSDNDSINDIDENSNGHLDTDNDGYIGSGDAGYADTDGDGIPDSADDNVNVFGDAGGTPPVDTDGDGIPDFQDLDSDNDSVNDIVENDNGNTDTNSNGYIDSGDTGYGDNDGDGIPDMTDNDDNVFGDPGGSDPVDTDGEGTPDFQDVDSDDPSDQTGDGTNDDIDESGNPSLDADNDGKVDDTSDPDGDGIVGDADNQPNEFGDLEPDIIATISADDFSLNITQEVDVVVNIIEILGAETFRTVTFAVPKLGSAFALTVDPNATSSTVLGGLVVSNPDWDIVEEVSRFVFTSKTGVTLDGGVSRVVLKVQATGTSTSKANFSVNVAGGSGGEARTNNNQAIRVFSINL